MALGGLKKLLLTAAVVLTALVIAGVAAAGGLYWYGVSRNQPVKALTTVKLSTAEARLGQEVTAIISFKCPWHRKPVGAQAELGKGAVLVEEPVIRPAGIGLGYRIWQVVVEMKAYRTGTVPSGRLDVQFNRYNEKTADLKNEFMIPPLQVVPLKLNAAQKLEVAEAIKPEALQQAYLKYFIAGGAVLLLIIIWIAIILLRRRKEQKIVITPWAAALLDLSQLRDGMRSGSVNLEKCFFRLTDIVRGYLENRFAVKATQQTTYEFLHDLREHGGPLPDKHRPFLEEFLTAADLVKFAKLPPDQKILNNALDKAEKLVNETRPGQEEQNDGGQK
ncbi:hypothetical protein P0136_13445 [Lentisphaerota bacterium ZTH]|nr:hypothetical protein JYG24_09040 [Lentisphaerota bacterium]WET06362.1 hypothetical protein P0136_13445 [Lentisphaerota bacterium ZTH]